MTGYDDVETTSSKTGLKAKLLTDEKENKPNEKKQNKNETVEALGNARKKMSRKSTNLVRLGTEISGDSES